MFNNNLNESLCHDCGAATNGWMSVNRGVFICDECTAAHLTLGRQISVVDHVTKCHPKILTLVRSLSSNGSNEIWEFLLKSNQENFQNQNKSYFSTNLGFRKPAPNDSFEIKKNFIFAKYKSMIFSTQLTNTNEKIQRLNKAFIDNIKSGNNLKTLKLASMGADVNYINTEDRGNSPLHYAVENNQHLQVELLIILGASPTIKNSSGLTPYEQADYYNCPDIKSRLIELSYELFNRFSLFLFNLLPDHSNEYHYILPIIEDKDIDRESRLHSLENVNDKNLEEICSDVFDIIERLHILQLLKETYKFDYDKLLSLPEVGSYTRSRNQFRSLLSKMNKKAIKYFVADLIETIHLREIASNSTEKILYQQKSLNDSINIVQQIDKSLDDENDYKMDEVMKSLNKVVIMKPNSSNPHPKTNPLFRADGISINKQRNCSSRNSIHIYDCMQRNDLSHTLSSSASSLSHDYDKITVGGQSSQQYCYTKTIVNNQDYDTIVHEKSDLNKQSIQKLIKSNDQDKNYDTIMQNNLINKPDNNLKATTNQLLTIENDYDKLEQSNDRFKQVYKPQQKITKETISNDYDTLNQDLYNTKTDSKLIIKSYHDKEYDTINTFEPSLEKRVFIKNKTKLTNSLKDDTYDTLNLDYHDEEIQFSSYHSTDSHDSHSNIQPVVLNEKLELNSNDNLQKNNQVKTIDYKKMIDYVTGKIDNMKATIQMFVESVKKNDINSFSTGLNETMVFINEIQNILQLDTKDANHKYLETIIHSTKKVIIQMTSLKNNFSHKKSGSSEASDDLSEKAAVKKTLEKVIHLSLELAKKFKELLIFLKKIDVS